MGFVRRQHRQSDTVGELAVVAAVVVVAVAGCKLAESCIDSSDLAHIDLALSSGRMNSNCALLRCS